jgi:hypothetical protein
MIAAALNFTVFIYVAGAFLAALIVSLVLRFAARRKFPEENASSDFIAEFARAPFLGLLWVWAVFILHGLISNFVTPQDRWPNYILAFLFLLGEGVIAFRVWKTWTQASHLGG